ncbi:MAG: hypothetical protein VB012_00785 [Erysipelotrichaceae bacterium]|nr:hypothetical protein [Erysipelotrichaceae bacterium]
MKLNSSAAALRQSVRGTWIVTINSGNYLDFVDFFSLSIQSEGYQWATGTGIKNGTSYSGYFQYDPDVMYLVGSPNDYVQMFLFSSAAAIRSTIQGTVLTVIPNGSSFTVLSFDNIVQSDGYRWMEVTGNVYTGYAQYDPAVMRPYGH